MKKTRKTPWSKVITASLMAVVLFVTSHFITYNIFSDDATTLAKAENITTSATDPECYYMKKVSPDIAFEIKNGSAKNPQDFELADSEGNDVDVSVKKGKSSFTIKPPKGGYKKGEDYTLILAEGTSFALEDLAGAKKLVFTIEQDEMAHYKFGDAVVEVDEPLELDSENVLKLPDDTELERGDIVFGKDKNGEYVAYKINAIYGDTADVELPAADELYEELVVYQSFKWDVKTIKPVDGSKENVVNDVTSTEFYRELVYQAYEGDTVMQDKLSAAQTGPQLMAAQSLSVDDFEFEYSKDEENNTVTFSLTIPIRPGEAGLFGLKNLKSHAINLNLSYTVGVTSDVDIESVKDWDISCTLGSDFSWSVEFELVNLEAEDDPDLDDFYNKTSDSFKNQKFIKRISDKIDRISKDYGDIDVDLFEWKIPISGVPGLFFEAEIEAVWSFEMSANITIGNTYYTSYTAGIRLKKGNFNYYTDEGAGSSSPTLVLRGTVGIKGGMQIEMMLCFVNKGIANIALTPQVGMYVDIYALAPILGADDMKTDKKLYVYVEFGVYMQVDVSAYVNLLGNNDLKFGPVTYEEKWPLKEWGSSKISLGIEPDESTVYAEDGVADVPQLTYEYYDAESGLKKRNILAPGKYKLYNEDGNEIRVSGGEIDVPDNLDSDGMLVTAKYEDDNDKELETEFVVLDDGSVVEGRVSAFNRGSHTPLSGAKVSLYKADNSGGLMASKITEDDGEFHFNVEAGTYKLVISAPHYKTLTTTQVVRENEIKYTEHLLLLDETMDGLGSANGTISDALNGEGISGVTIKLRNEWNNTTGDYVEDFSTRTDSYGGYTIEDIPIGYYTIEATVDGYITTHSNILVLDDRDLVDFDFAMTPTLEEGKVRIILNWGESPSDLDSHLIGRTPDGDTFNVYYSDKSYYYDGVEMANLDHDDTTSYGPETVTILEEIHGTYIYAIHDYSNGGSTSSNALSYSGAHIRVMVGGRDEIQEFHVPVNRTGIYWTVFTIDSNYNIVPVNTISNTKPTP